MVKSHTKKSVAELHLWQEIDKLGHASVLIINTDILNMQNHLNERHKVLYLDNNPLGPVRFRPSCNSEIVLCVLLDYLSLTQLNVLRYGFSLNAMECHLC